jgi:hypothetical protein
VVCLAHREDDASAESAWKVLHEHAAWTTLLSLSLSCRNDPRLAAILSRRQTSLSIAVAWSENRLHRLTCPVN